MKDAPQQLNLPGVPRAKQGREVAPHWAWTKAQVWTERMLATLERGIEGGKWYSLIDKLWKEATLREAAEAAKGTSMERWTAGYECAYVVSSDAEPDARAGGDLTIANIPIAISRNSG